VIKKLLLSLGSNQGDRDYYLSEANKRLSSEFGNPVLQSGIFETNPVGVEGHPVYLNQVLVYDCRISIRQAFTVCRGIETALGRRGKGELLPRSIDIDLCSFGDEIVSDPDLIVPHPSMHLRRFVLEPLVSIWPDWFHPLLGKTASAMLQELLEGDQVTD
jgi:2-amino-4-hydroxy-6-hydroxymethyldihydropteridine diphosphokinase